MAGTDLKKIKDSLSEYIVTPANIFGLGGFIFDIEEGTTLNSQSIITDNFVEDNTAVQDHIAVQPLKVTLRSRVGETVFRSAETIEDFIEEVIQKLTILDSYLPKLAQAEQQIRDLAGTDIATLTTEKINDLLDLWSLSKNLINMNSRQQQAYLFFKALQEKKILTSVQTPFEFLTNMAIESIAATQDADSKFVSTFTITLKQIRTASVTFVKFDPKKYQSRTSLQREPVDKQGKTQGLESSLSILFDEFGLGEGEVPL